MSWNLTRTQTTNWIKWISALESGRYEQIAGALYKGRNSKAQKMMCCLGVACDVTIRGRRWLGGGNSVRSICGSTAVLPPAASQALNINMWGRLPYLGETYELAPINDRSCDGKYTSVLPHLRLHLKTYGHKSLKKEVGKLLKGKEIAA